MKTLKENLAVLMKSLPALLPHHEGKYALICNDNLTVHETADMALEAATKACQDLTQLLIIKIEPLSLDQSIWALAS